VSEEVNSKLRAKNTLVQLITLYTDLYTDPERHNARRYRRTDGQTDDILMPIADHTVSTKIGKNVCGRISAVPSTEGNIMFSNFSLMYCSTDFVPDCQKTLADQIIEINLGLLNVREVAYYLLGYIYFVVYKLTSISRRKSQRYI